MHSLPLPHLETVPRSVQAIPVFVPDRSRSPLPPDSNPTTVPGLGAARRLVPRAASYDAIRAAADFFRRTPDDSLPGAQPVQSASNDALFPLIFPGRCEKRPQPAALSHSPPPPFSYLLREPTAPVRALHATGSSCWP